MRTLSLHQPWASLVMLGEKTWETRTWGTNYRGRLAIHASAKLPPGLDAILAVTPHFEHVLASYKDPLTGRGLTVEDLSLGAVLGTVWLTDVVETEDVEALTINDANFGDWTPGRTAWKLQGPIPFPTPYPAKGRLGLWEWDAPAEVEFPRRIVLPQ